jgi:hypothetical protein
MKRIGFRHFGQGGGGGFLAMALTSSGRALPNSQSPILAEGLR